MISVINKFDYKLDNNASFLQSLEWGDFQEFSGHTVIRLSTGKNNIQGIIKTKARFYKEAYFGGTNLSEEEIKEVVDYFKQKKYTVVQFDQVTNAQGEPAIRQPGQTMVLDLQKSTDELFLNMHSKTRYNIRLAEKKGVTIKQEKNILGFWVLNTETSDRSNFTPHEKKYYETLFNLDIVKQFSASINGKLLASNLCLEYNGTFYYLHGASSRENKNLMAPYLLQWKQIQYAKEKGFNIYDFWGVAPKAETGETFHNYTWKKNHKWSGFTRFKAGFGGEYKRIFTGAEFVLAPMKYKLAKISRVVKSIVDFLLYLAWAAS